MSIYAPTPAGALREALYGDLFVCVDDDAYAKTAAERVRDARDAGATGPTVHIKFGVECDCACGTWQEGGVCWHACALVDLMTHTLHQTRLAEQWVSLHGSKPFPAGIRKALGVAARLTIAGARVWPGMLPDDVRPAMKPASARDRYDSNNQHRSEELS